VDQQPDMELSKLFSD